MVSDLIWVTINTLHITHFTRKFIWQNDNTMQNTKAVGTYGLFLVNNLHSARNNALEIFLNDMRYINIDVLLT